MNRLLLPSYYAGSNGGGGNPGNSANALRRPLSFTDLGIDPVAAFNFGEFEEADTSSPNLVSSSLYGDLTESSAITGDFKVDMSGEPRNAGGAGFTKNPDAGHFQLLPADHNISNGEFSLSLAFALPFGLGAVIGSFLFIGPSSGQRVFVEPEVNEVQFNSGANNARSRALREGGALNELIISRRPTGEIDFFLNGELRYTAPANTTDFSAFSVFVASARMRFTPIEFQVFDQALSDALAATKWNRGFGTFYNAAGGQA